MANRHAHKKLRAEIRARMAARGLSYQQARARILSHPPSGPAPRADLVSFSYFGMPATLATIESHGMAMVVVIPSSSLWGRGLYPHPYPLRLLRSAMRPRGVQ